MASTEMVAYVNGDIVPRSNATVSINDPGFTWGYNVYDVFRTVNHDPYLLDNHLERLYRSCRSVRIDPDLSKPELRDVCRDIVERNTRTIEDDDDLWVAINVSGSWSVYPEPDRDDSTTITVDSDTIPFSQNAYKFEEGASLVTPSTRHIPRQCLSPNIKHRSRMHLVLADLEAKQSDPEADPLLLDTEGNVTEVKHANIFVVDDGVLRTPPSQRVLPGVSREVTLEVAREDLEVDVAVENLQRHDVYNADEVFYTNTTHFVVPVTSVDDTAIGTGSPGEITERLIEEHSNRAGVDIVDQFQSHATD